MPKSWYLGLGLEILPDQFVVFEPGASDVTPPREGFSGALGLTGFLIGDL